MTTRGRKPVIGLSSELSLAPCSNRRQFDPIQAIQHANRIRAIADGIPDVPAAGEATAGPRIRQARLQRFDVAVDV